MYHLQQLKHYNPDTKTGNLDSVLLSQYGIKNLSSHLLTERQQALATLEHEGSFHCHDQEKDSTDQGPFHLEISLIGHRLTLSFKNDVGGQAQEFALSTRPLKKLIKDYFLICESYYQALQQNLGRLEALDMGRRALHDEAADKILKQLAPSITSNKQTCRCLFTLLCLLHFRNGAYL